MKGILEPYVVFNGNAKEAFEFYQKVFEISDLNLMTIKDLPPGEEMEGFDPDSVMHASLKIGDIMLMGSDNFIGEEAEKSGIFLSWASKNEEEVDKVWKAFIDAGSEIVMDMERTFWSEKYGIVKDPYGARWMIQVYEHEEMG